MTLSELTLEILQRNYDIETGELERKIRQNERQSVIKEIESWLVDDVLREKSDMLEAVYHRQKGRNDLRAELRAKLVEMKGENET